MPEKKVGIRVTESKLVKGALILAIAAIVSKLLGTLQKIPLQNIAGDEVFGIYNAVHPFYTFILLLASAGIPVAVSKFVSESMEDGNVHFAIRLTWMACGLLSLTGVVFFLILFFGAEPISKWMGSAEVTPALKSVSFALIFVPVLGVLRGYFQGKQQMVPTAVSQVFEQLVRVATMIGLLLFLTSTQQSNQIVAAGATFGSVTGAVAGLVWMLWIWLREVKRMQPEASTYSNHYDISYTSILMYALSVCVGAIVFPLLTLVDSFTLPRLLAQGMNLPGEAFRQFGIYSRGLPIVQLVSMIFSSVSVALVPAISEAKAKGECKKVRHQTELSLRLTWWMASAAMVGLILTVKPINQMFYTNTEGSAAIAILSFTIVFSALQIVSTSILQGLGLAKLPAFYLLIAAIIKCFFNVLLVPTWGIEGAAVSAVLTFFVAAALNLIAVVKHTGVRFSWHDYVYKPSLSLGVMAGSLMLVLQLLPAILSVFHLQDRLEQTITALIAVVIGVLVYVICSIRIGIISPEEWSTVPQLHTKLKRYIVWRR